MAAMPRFFFHVRFVDNSVIHDADGIQFRDLAAARADAANAVEGTTLQQRAAGEMLVMTAIEIADETGQVVAVVPFTRPAAH